ncbi:MAG: hypothetical protein WA414_04500 [Acidobacteriaceae bacterium]
MQINKLIPSEELGGSYFQRLQVAMGAADILQSFPSNPDDLRQSDISAA